VLNLASKYEKYLVRDLILKEQMGQTLHVNAKILPNFPVEMVITGIRDHRFWGNPPPHAHNADEIFFFLGGNAENFFDSDFEIEYWIGEKDEREKIIINSPSVLYIPKGTLHCPLVFNKLNKPIFYGHILLEPLYERSRGGSTPPRPIRPYTPDEIKKLKAGILVP
jgi:mannose-6-phosphate isomerase-like protein (cupin superfamily)